MKRRLIAAGLAGLIPTLTLPAFFRDIKRARQRQQGFNSKIIHTDKGPVEYATAGEGETVLVVHGAATGYDQGIITGRESIGEGYHIIAPSRFGYQRTPLPEDASPEAQADALASFLDALTLTRVPVIATSAGAPSCVQLALRHPDRVSSLVLIVPGMYGPKSSKKTNPISFGFMLASLFHSNYPLWVATKVNPQKVLLTIGIPTAIQQQLSAERKADLLNWVQPYNDRIAGVMNDGKNAANLKPLPLHNIVTPTLVFSAKDDLWDTYGPAEYTATHISKAIFFGFDTGGHLLSGHEEKVRSEIRTFLRQHTLEPAPILK